MERKRKVSLKEINHLRILCLKNAGELIEEAELLLKAKRYPRAFVLSEIALEELAKIPMLVGYVNRDVNKLPSREEFSKRWSNHINKKIVAGIMSGIPTTELGVSAIAANHYKNFGLYVDLTKKGPVMPRNLIGKGLARSSYTIALITYKKLLRSEKIIGSIGEEHLKLFKTPEFKKIMSDAVNSEEGLKNLLKIVQEFWSVI